MRDEERRFSDESDARHRFSRMCGKLQKEKSLPKTTLADSLVAIASIPKPVGGGEFRCSVRQERYFKINRNWPNCWSYDA